MRMHLISELEGKTTWRKYMKQKLKKLQEEMNKCTGIFGNFRTPLSATEMDKKQPTGI